MNNIYEMIREKCPDPGEQEELVGLLRLAFNSKRELAEKVEHMKEEILDG